MYKFHVDLVNTECGVDQNITLCILSIESAPTISTLNCLYVCCYFYNGLCMFHSDASDFTIVETSVLSLFPIATGCCGAWCI